MWQHSRANFSVLLTLNSSLDVLIFSAGFVLDFQPFVTLLKDTELILSWKLKSNLYFCLAWKGVIQFAVMQC